MLEWGFVQNEFNNLWSPALENIHMMAVTNSKRGIVLLHKFSLVHMLLFIYYSGGNMQNQGCGNTSPS
jgi:uncharacterized protein (DUF2062 family)